MKFAVYRMKMPHVLEPQPIVYRTVDVCSWNLKFPYLPFSYHVVRLYIIYFKKRSGASQMLTAEMENSKPVQRVICYFFTTSNYIHVVLGSYCPFFTVLGKRFQVHHFVFKMIFKISIPIVGYCYKGCVRH